MEIETLFIDNHLDIQSFGVKNEMAGFWLKMNTPAKANKHFFADLKKWSNTVGIIFRL